MTNPLMKGIGILTVTAFTLSTAYAEEPAIRMQNYTSSISITTSDDHLVTQQVGSPLSYPIKLMGESVATQGLFGLLTKLDSGTSGVDNIPYSHHDGIHLSFDAVNNTLTVDTSIDPGKVRVAVTDLSGATILAITTDDLEATIQLPGLTPGVYIAAVATTNNYFKSIKFTVK